MPRDNSKITPFQSYWRLVRTAGMVLLFSPAVFGEIVADPTAPGNQQPVIIPSANGTPQVNIQTPSAGGVSRNVYSQFDVNQQGVILNNAKENTATQLGGYVQGNPFLTGGTARIILNEVNSNDPSRLYGFIEVAGDRAEVIIANPSGITCDGCGFINASRGTLTTGTPIITDGHLEGYLVERGMVTIDGQGLDASRTDYTDIVARAVKVNAGIWANDLSVVTGSNRVSSSGREAIAVASETTKPKVAIDTSQLGGMYAGKIRLVGTEAGVGVVNAGQIGASAGEFTLTAAGDVINTGNITSQGDTRMHATGNVINHGTVYAKGHAEVTTTGRVENSGVMAAKGNTRVVADGSGSGIANRQNAILAAGVDSDGTLTSSGELSLWTSQGIALAGQAIAGRTIDLHADTLDVAASGEIVAPTTQLTARFITNRGLIDGTDTTMDAGQLDNIGTGRIYGDHLAIAADTVNNLDEAGIAATIAARNRLDLGIGTLTNREHGLIYSDGDMAIGGLLDEDGRATGTADGIYNHSATLQAMGDMAITTKTLENTNDHFSTEVVEVSREPITEYQLTGHYNRYRPDQVGHWFGEVWFLVTPEGTLDDYNVYNYTRTVQETRIAQTDPGRILAGGGMKVVADQVLNDKSQILAGGDLVASVGDLQNIDVSGQRITHDVGTVQHYYRIKERGTDDQGIDYTGYYPPARVETIPLVASDFVGHATVSGDNPIIRSGGIPTTLPHSSLYRSNPDANGHYFIETDPRFTQYRNWLSSDYMLQRVSSDPNYILKRLGDGFYEQQLVLQQLAQLTGRQFTANYSDSEAQYRALMDNGLAVADDLALRPGIALTAEQIAQLMTDIVWLVEQDVILPDGTATRAVIPQVYARVKPGDITGDGALIGGRSAALTLRGNLLNSGTLAVQEAIKISANTIENREGRITGNNTFLYAQNDLLNLGGTLDAKQNLTLLAGHDLTFAATTHSNSNAQGSLTNIASLATASVSGKEGELILAAGHDLTLNAAAITHSGEAGTTTLSAGNNLTLGTVQEQRQEHITWNADNYRHEGATVDVGSSVQTAGNLTLVAGNNLTATAAHVTSQQGTLIAQAGNTLTVTAGKASVSANEAHKVEGGNGMFSSTTTTTRDSMAQTQALGSQLSGEEVLLMAGKDVAVTGSSVVSDQDLLFNAGGNIALEAATNTYLENHYHREDTSGAFGSVASGGFTVGTQQVENTLNSQGTTASGSLIGSVNGNIALQAGDTYRQTGSQVIAPVGDIAVLAKQILIEAAQDTNTTTQHTHVEQTGLSVQVTNPVISAIQTGQQMYQAAGQTDNGRLQALAAGTTALAAKNAYDAVTSDPWHAGGINISLGFGTSTSDSSTTQTSTTAVSSTLAAGRDIALTATGNGSNSDLTMTGSQVTAGRDATLQAEGDIRLLAAQNRSSQVSDNSSQSASIGVGVNIGASGASFNAFANGSTGSGSGQSQDITYTPTVVSAGRTASISSGNDTQLSGAILTGKQVIADIAGNFLLESLQDTSTYSSHQRNSSVGISAPIGGGGFSASANHSTTDMDSNYASVTHQTGIQAGDNGFQLHVGGNTHLTGAVIASTEQAVKDNKNSLSTGTLTTSDLENHASYSANSTSMGAGYSTPQGGIGHNQSGQAQGGSQQVPGTRLPGMNGITATPPTAMSAGDSSQSTTPSGISGGTITIRDEYKQQQLTGKDAATTIAELNRDVATGKDTTNSLTPIFDPNAIQAAFTITSSFSREAGTFLDNRAKESTAAKAELEAELAKPKDQQDSSKIASLNQTLANNAIWEMGGAGRQILTAVTLAASGNVTGSGAQFIQAAAVNYLQSLAVDVVKQIADDLHSETARTALQSLVACGGAAVQQQSCSQAATGAAASVVLNNLVTGLTGQNAQRLTPEERQARENLITTLITGITTAAGGDATLTLASAQMEMENNSLRTNLQKILGYGLIIGGIPLDESGIGEGMQVGGGLLNKEANIEEALEEAKAISEKKDEQSVADTKPDLADNDARKHILEGDENGGGGGHRPGAGIPGKSEFPSDWSDDKIMGEISDVATDPSSSRTPGLYGRTVVEGMRDGVKIRVIIDSNGRIITGFPTNLPRNPIP